MSSIKKKKLDKIINNRDKNLSSKPINIFLPTIVCFCWFPAKLTPFKSDNPRKLTYIVKVHVIYLSLWHSFLLTESSITTLTFLLLTSWRLLEVGSCLYVAEFPTTKGLVKQMAIFVHVTTMMAKGMKYITTNRMTKKILLKSPVWPSNSSKRSEQSSPVNVPSSLEMVKGSALLKQ